MKSKTSAHAAALVAGVALVVAGAASAQDSRIDALEQAHGSMIERAFAGMRAPTPAQQLFHLWMADLLLLPGQEAAGFERVVAAGALSTLLELSGDTNPDVADAAAALRRRLVEELDLESARVGTARPLDLTMGRQDLDVGEYDRWLVIDTDADREYRIEPRGCPVLSAIAVGPARTDALAGGVVTRGRFLFRSDTAGIAFLRIRTPSCGASGGIALSAARRPVPLDPPASAADARRTPALSPGAAYRAVLAGNADHWLLLNVERNTRYEITTVPETDLIDTVLTIYDGDTMTELHSDDDGGVDFGSRVEFTPPADGAVLVNIHALGTERGAYELLLGTKAPGPTLARQVEPGVHEGSLTQADEEWFRVEGRPGRVYVFETEPRDDLDTILRVFTSDGVIELTSDDDSGPGLGSRVELVNPDETTLLVQVRALDDARGRYGFTVSERQLPFEIARTFDGTEQAGALTDVETEQWWRLEARGGMAYVMEAIPESELDTIVTVYAADGVTQLASNDDAEGLGFGSRVEFTNAQDRTLLVKVQRYGSTTGEYRLSVTMR